MRVRRTIGVSDGEILISLNPEEHGSTAEYTGRLRKRLHERFPDVVFFFEAANITNQILNFGLPAPIDVQVAGRNATVNYDFATQLAAQIREPSQSRRRILALSHEFADRRRDGQVAGVLAGNHFVQEDQGPAIGTALAAWRRRHRLGA